MEERICKYRNCDLEITHKRSQALYCSRKHKTYEGIYRSRERKKIIKEFKTDCTE